MSGDSDGSWRDRYPVLFVYLIVVGIPAALFVVAGFLYFVLTFNISAD